MTYTDLASKESVEKTIEALAAHNFQPIVVSNKEEALEKIKELIPQGASIMNGASTTLQEIGFVDYLKEGNHGWNNLHVAILGETDPEKQKELRQRAVSSDVYLGSVHALTETGEMIIASNSGSQLPHLAFTSSVCILVVGAQKIVPDVRAGLARIDDHVLALEDERMKKVLGYGTLHAKTLILHKENPALGRAVKVVIVQESLGF